MATFGRTKLMGVTIKRFLVQLQRHHPELYGALDLALLARYAPSQAKMFGDFAGSRTALRQQVAEDLLLLVSRFADDERVTGRSSYQAMARVLAEQCDVVEETVELKNKTGGDVLQNPSDPEATYDGHKGPGHQAQIAETCSAENEVQLITGVQTEPAHASDQNACVPMIDQLEAQDRKPEILYADGQYGSDANVVEAAKRGVDLQSPVAGAPQQNPNDLTIDDFVIGEETQTIDRCPNGHEPVTSVHDPDKGRTRTVMDGAHCLACPFRNQCPVKQVRGQYVLEHTPAEHRLASRRAEQATEVFRENYAIRGGGESVNAGLKRKTGMGRLRVRGSLRVRMAVLLRCAGWNLFRALTAMKRRGIAGLGAFFAAGTLLRALAGRFGRQIEAADGFRSHPPTPGPRSPLLAAA
jgi:IS5 family transposase